MRQKQRITFFSSLPGIILFALFVSLLASCANQVAPTGGPKDESPPKVVREEPANFSKNFSSSRIRITFDEFVSLESPQKNVLISPPFSVQPEIKLHGRTLDIQLKDSLRSNTTYTIYFSNAIADITEGNKLRNYSFVFSTGELIDMYAISGKVSDAFTLSAEDGMAVMLYPAMGDTLPFKTRPYYLSRSNAQGEFEFNNIGAGPFMLIALSDANSNLIYDLPNEKIAFVDTAIVPYELEELIDSAKGRVSFYAENAVQRHLFSFDEYDRNFKVMKAGMRSPGLAEIILNRPSDSLDVRILSGSDPKLRKELSIRKDSLLLWLQVPAPDSLLLEIRVNGQTFDSALIFPGRGVSGVKAGSEPRLRLQTNIAAGGKHPSSQECRISFNFPILTHRDSLISLIEGEDTIIPPIRFEDEILRKSIVLDYQWKENQTYTLRISEGAFSSLNALSSDSLRLSFSTYQAGDLGNLRILLEDSLRHGDLILSLLDKSGRELSRVKLGMGLNKAEFNGLLPGEYSLKALHDANMNGYWDPGTSLPPRQPERITIYQKPISIKANWDLELDWQIR